MITFLISAEEKDGKRKFLADIFEKYYDAMLRKAEKLIPDSEDAAELVQEVFIDFIERAEGIMAVEEKKLPAYLMSSVRFASYNYYRRKRTEKKHLVFESFEEDAELLCDEKAIPEELFIKKEAAEALCAALEKIPEKYRNILEYKYILGLSDREIGARINISENSVRSCLTRARRKAFAVMKEECSGE